MTCLTIGEHFTALKLVLVVSWPTDFFMFQIFAWSSNLYQVTYIRPWQLTVFKQKKFSIPDVVVWHIDISKNKCFWQGLVTSMSPPTLLYDVIMQILFQWVYKIIFDKLWLASMPDNLVFHLGLLCLGWSHNVCCLRPEITDNFARTRATVLTTFTILTTIQ